MDSLLNFLLLGVLLDDNAAPTISPASFSVAEDAANGTVVGTPTASDPEGGALTWTIQSGNSSGKFAINSSTGQITVASALGDYLRNPSYSLVVRVTDAAGLYAEATITITATAMASMIQFLKLDETSGTNANDSSAENNDGTYSGVTLNNATSVYGVGMPLFDGVNDYVNAYSVALNTDFNGQECSGIVWIRVNSASVWTDGVLREVFRLRVDASNQIQLYKNSGINQILWVYTAGGTTKTVTKSSVSPTGLISVGFTVSKAADEFRAFYSAAQEGATQTGLGTWTGALSNATLGAGSTGGANPWFGWLSYWRLYNRRLSVAEITNRMAYP